MKPEEQYLRNHPSLSNTTLTSPESLSISIIHEVAHEYLHLDTKEIIESSRRIRETKAEGVAFVVLSHLRLPTEVPVYIALQGGTGKTIIACAENIAKDSHVILSYLMEKTGWELELLESASAKA